MLEGFWNFPQLRPHIMSDTISFHHLHSSLNHEVKWNIMIDRTWHALSWSQMHQLGSLWSNKLQLRATWRLKTWFLFVCLFVFWGPIYLICREPFLNLSQENDLEPDPCSLLSVTRFWNNPTYISSSDSF